MLGYSQAKDVIEQKTITKLYIHPGAPPLMLGELQTKSKINSFKAQFLKGEVSVINVSIWAQKNLQENCSQVVVDPDPVCLPLATWQKS